jgi:hypothetical protein
MSKPTKMVMSAKCSDCFSAQFDDAEGNEVIDYHGYVPDWFPEQHWGDYVQFEIDLATGKILNWKAPTDDDLKAMEKDK